jgi:hypothetical protein
MVFKFVGSLVAEKNKITLFCHLGMQRVSFQGPEEFWTWGNVKKIYGWREKWPGINSGIVNPWQWNFLMGS